MLRNMIMGSVQGSRETLLGSFCADEVEKIIYEATAEAERLYAENEELRTPAKSMFVGSIVGLAAFCAAMYGPLCRYTDPYNAKLVLQRCVEVMSDRSKYGTEEGKKLFSDIDKVRESALKMIADNKDIPEGEYRFVYRVHDWDLDNQLYAFDVLECPALKFLQKVNMPEVCECLCNYDHHQARLLPGGVKLRRHETIAAGGEKCDMNYYFDR